MTPDRRSLSRLLQDLHRTAPSLSRPVLGPFRELWHGHVHRAYAASEEELLPLYVANREVAALAQGAHAEEYRSLALLNAARLEARLGGAPTRAASAALGEAGPDEAHWLAWCRWWLFGAEGGSPPGEWNPTSDRWRVLRAGTAALAAARRAGSLAAYTHVTSPDEMPNEPLALLRRLARLHEARLYLEEGARGAREAAFLAAEAGRDGDLLAAQAAWLLQPPSAQQAAVWGETFRFRGYRSRRLAERLERAGFPLAAARQRQQRAGWDALAARCAAVPPEIRLRQSLPAETAPGG